MFLMAFSYVARALQLSLQSLNNNNRPNKNNDVITDLGGEGDFPMFRSGTTLFPASTVPPPVGVVLSVCAYRGATYF